MTYLPLKTLLLLSCISQVSTQIWRGRLLAQGQGGNRVHNDRTITVYRENQGKGQAAAHVSTAYDILNTLATGIWHRPSLLGSMVSVF